MVNRLSIRARLVWITVLVLTICCIGLTIIINYSATQMATQVAQVTVPAQSIDSLDQGDAIQSPALSTSNAFTYTDMQQQIIDHFYRNSLLYMLFIIIVGGGLMYVFSKRILHPLVELNEKIKNSTISTLSDQIPVPNSHDELSEISISFNKMTHRIQEAFMFQQQFSANVAHELRTPLTILKTKIEVFHKKEDRQLSEYKDLVVDLNNQVSRLSDLVQTLLELTNTDKIQEKEIISLSDMIENILLDFSDVAQKRHIEFSLDLQDTILYGNVDLLYRVFYNLIQNSIRYNIEYGTISISAKHTQDKTIITLCDSGIGITAEHKQRVFEPFFRSNQSRSRSMGGAGLGLSIVKNIIEKHHGTITISDQIPQGTCFTIELPLQDFES